MIVVLLVTEMLVNHYVNYFSTAKSYMMLHIVMMVFNLVITV